MSEGIIFTIIGIMVGVILAVIVSRIERELRKKKLGWIVTFTIVGFSIIICAIIFIITSDPSFTMDQSIGYGLLFAIVSFIALRQINYYLSLGKAKQEERKNNNPANKIN
jgi:peptidoglycan/LPS O-acetylase OafA/YrhL